MARKPKAQENLQDFPSTPAGDPPLESPDLGAPEDAASVNAQPPTDSGAQTEPEAPRKRGRGRPPNSETKSERPKKTGARREADIAGLAGQIVGIHTIVAMVTGMPELRIHDAEAMALAKGVTAVADEYGLNFGGKTGAAIQLFAAAGMVYGPRAFAIRARLMKEKADAEAAEHAAQNGGAVMSATGGFVAPVNGAAH